MLTQNLGFPRIGANRELKKACESYWAGKISEQELFTAGRSERQKNWLLQKNCGIDLIPCNDFSYYDHVHDMTFMLGVIPERFKPLKEKLSDIDLYFSMCRGFQSDGFDVKAMEMTKWFDTNYHYIVPEFNKNQKFALTHSKLIDEFREAIAYGIENPKPVLIGPVTYLLLGKEQQSGFKRFELIETLLPEYIKIVKELESLGCNYIQIDEPFLVTNLTPAISSVYNYTYCELNKKIKKIKIILATFFGGLEDNLQLALNLPVNALHIDLIRGGNCLNEILNNLPQDMNLSLGIVDGRNIWKNDFQQSLDILNKVRYKIGENRMIIAPSCSLLHVPYNIEHETSMPESIKQWMAFGKQKLEELAILKELMTTYPSEKASDKYSKNQQDIKKRKTFIKDNQKTIKFNDNFNDFFRSKPFDVRFALQKKKLNLPLFPLTTIGSFPQTTEVRKKRQEYKKGLISEQEYEGFLKNEIEKTIKWQDNTGLDILAHGEFERNDMVEYFGEQLEGFVITKNAWVQSYGSRAVKPPIIYGEVKRIKPMTVKWTVFAQSLTAKKVKGMLTGPVTILQWSFVRDDQPRMITAFEIAKAIKEEVLDLEKAGIEIIQIDEPALREGLPLRREKWEEYLNWAVKAFRMCCSEVKEETQIHTHMCYAEFNDIINSINEMDADVITIETSRSQMELLEAFKVNSYPNHIGPGVYDIHSPRIPSVEEMQNLIEKAMKYIPKEKLWINPDCGLKTRRWEEVKPALENMVKAAINLRKQTAVII
jgi:5-methyltetrahydropteroyltriglutamate--homocysteine methyltransferase